MKKVLFPVVLLMLCFLFLPLSPAEERVFLSTETTSFDKDADLLTLRVAGTYGGDSMLLTYGDETMLIDAGIDTFSPWIEQMLSEAGSNNHVDTFFSTHPHRDHLEGLFPLLEKGLAVGRICTVFPHDYHPDERSVMQNRLMQAAENYSIPIVDMKTGDTFSFGPAEITVFRLPDDRIAARMRTNDLSAMLLIRYGECSILLTGDVEWESQAILAGLYDLKADIMKAPHHGYSPMSLDFLNNIDPEFVFITNGSVDTRLARSQLELEHRSRYLYSSWGEITFQTDGTRWIVSQDFRPDLRTHAESHWQRITRQPDEPSSGT